MNKNEPTSASDYCQAGLGLTGLILIGLSPWQLGLFETGEGWYRGDLLVPFISLGIMVLASIPAWVRLWQKRGRKFEADKEGLMLSTLYIFIFMLIFIGGLIFVGVVPSILILMPVTLYLLGQRNWLIISISTAVITTLAWLFFIKILDLYFPDPLLFEILGWV